MNVLAQPMTIAGLLVTGIGVALLGSIKLSLARRLQIDEARIGGLVSAFGFTIIPMILVSGFLADHFGQKTVIIVGSILMALGMFILSRTNSYGAALVSVLLLGSAWSALVNAINAIVPSAFPGTMAYATNLSNVFFGIGAFITPIGLSYLLKRMNLPPILTVLGILVLIPGVLAFAVDFSQLFAVETGGTAIPSVEETTLGELLMNPMLWLCSLGMFFYSPLEASMGAWSTTYLGNQGISEDTALKWLSGFWLAFMLTRLITAFTISEGAETTVLIVLSLLCAAVMAMVVWGRGAAVGKSAVIGAGLVFGPVFPLILALLLTSVALEARGRAIGIFFAIGAIGWTVIPAMIGAKAKKEGVQRGFIVGVGSAIGLIVVSFLFMYQLG